MGLYEMRLEHTGGRISGNWIDGTLRLENTADNLEIFDNELTTVSDAGATDCRFWNNEGHAGIFNITTDNNAVINAAAVSAHYDLMLAGDGVLGLKETTTPTADAGYGKIYTKSDNKLYVQTGDGNEHEIAFV